MSLGSAPNLLGPGVPSLRTSEIHHRNWSGKPMYGIKGRAQYPAVAPGPVPMSFNLLTTVADCIHKPNGTRVRTETKNPSIVFQSSITSHKTTSKDQKIMRANIEAIKNFFLPIRPSYENNIHVIPSGVSESLSYKASDCFAVLE